MEFLAKEIQAYVDDKSSPEPELLTQLSRETHLKVLYPQMLSGHGQGRYLSMVSNMLAPQRILEVGTYTGYSCICLAEGLAEGGKITTMDVNRQLEPMLINYFEQAGILDKVDLRFGKGMEIIPTLEDGFDLAFIDADKVNYLNYYEAILPKLKKGGILLADNVLWSGKVVDPGANEPDTVGIRAFNDRVSTDERVACVMLPIRDGLMMVRKL